MNPLIVGGIAAAVVLVWGLRSKEWVGFSDKTLWDWTSLLLVPAILAAGAGLINVGQNQAANDRAEELAVQAYIDRISTLVLATEPSEDTNAIGRAQTAAVLRTVNGERAGQVLFFLHEMGLLQDYQVSLEGLDLSRSELKDVDLAGHEFEDANLRRADLEGALLSGSDFEGADLGGADLKDADLSGSSFEDAELGGADLDHADLRGADLSDANGLSSDQVAEACIDSRTRLPDGLDVDADEDACAGSAEDDD